MIDAVKANTRGKRESRGSIGDGLSYSEWLDASASSGRRRDPPDILTGMTAVHLHVAGPCGVAQLAGPGRLAPGTPMQVGFESWGREPFNREGREKTRLRINEEVHPARLASIHDPALRTFLIASDTRVAHRTSPGHACGPQHQDETI